MFLLLKYPNVLPFLSILATFLLMLIPFWRSLKRREAAGDLVAVAVNEYKTSKACNACSNNLLTSMPNLKGRSVLICNTYKTLWQRDVNACKTMLSTSLSV